MKHQNGRPVKVSFDGGDVDDLIEAVKNRLFSGLNFSSSQYTIFSSLFSINTFVFKCSQANLCSHENAALGKDRQNVVLQTMAQFFFLSLSFIKRNACGRTSL